MGRRLAATAIVAATLAGCGDDSDSADVADVGSDVGSGGVETSSADEDTDRGTDATPSDDLVSEALCTDIDGLAIAGVGVLELRNNVQISDRARQCSYLVDGPAGALTFTVDLDGAGNADFLRSLAASGEGEELERIGDIAVAVEEQGVRASLAGDVLFDVNVIVSEDETTGAASTDLALSEIAARALLEEIEGLG